MNDQGPGGADLFENGPVAALQRLFRLMRPGRPNVALRAVLVAVIGWLPLPILVLGGVWLGERGDLLAFLREVGVHARSLVAAPLLVVAEASCAPGLNAIIRHFVDSGLVPEGERARFEAAVAQTRRCLRSRLAEAGAVALAYGLSVMTIALFPGDDLPGWAVRTGGGFSAAGWWHLLVSAPLLLMLVLGWLWRLLLWAWLMLRIAGLKLRLVASHPDRAGGLGFVGFSLRAFIAPMTALAVLPAGRLAHEALVNGQLAPQQIQINAAFVVVVLLLPIAPLLVFTPLLLRLRRQGTVVYGALAGRVGRDFEARWLDPADAPDGSPLERADFSATTDLYAVVANVGAIRPAPVDRESLLTLLGAMLLPFAPAVLMLIPAASVLTFLKALLL